MREEGRARVGGGGRHLEGGLSPCSAVGMWAGRELRWEVRAGKESQGAGLKGHFISRPKPGAPGRPQCREQNEKSRVRLKGFLVLSMNFGVGSPRSAFNQSLILSGSPNSCGLQFAYPDVRPT